MNPIRAMESNSENWIINWQRGIRLDSIHVKFVRIFSDKSLSMETTFQFGSIAFARHFEAISKQFQSNFFKKNVDEIVLIKSIEFSRTKRSKSY